MNLSTLSIVFAKRIYEFLDPIDDLRKTYICGGSPQRVKLSSVFGQQNNFVRAQIFVLLLCIVTITIDIFVNISSFLILFNNNYY